MQKHKNIEHGFEKYLSQEKKETSWIKALCFGILRKQSILDWVIAHFIHQKKMKLDLGVRLILYIGLYQLLFMETKAHAAIFETVELSKQKSLQHASGFINALLQKTAHAGKDLLASVPTEIQYNHPEWLLHKIKTAYPTEWEQVILANNQHPPLFLRVNQRKISREKYADLLQQNQIAHQLPTGFDFAIEILDPVDIKTLPGFQEGFFSVQDIAAQQSAILLDLKAGQAVLDACAAPGGKTCHILEMADVTLWANDADAKRIIKVAQNLERLHLQAKLLTHNALQLEFAKYTFDRILLDAPCSATGVIRRHPDIRLLRRETDIAQLAEMQKQLLQHLWPMLKPGGIFLYATCSILPDENDAIIQAFLQSHQDAQFQPLQFEYGKQTPYGWQFLPKSHGPDGFYYAKLIKTDPLAF